MTRRSYLLAAIVGAGVLAGGHGATRAAPPADQFAQSVTPPAVAAPGHHERMIERFRRANVTNDGKLTREQASAGGLRVVASHFDAIDTAHKGYVTLDDLRAARAVRQQMKANPAAQ